MNKILIHNLKIVFLAFIFIINLTSCYKTSLIEYYSNESNFIEVTAKIKFLNYTENMDSIYIEFYGLPDDFQDTCFKIDGENMKILKDNNCEKKLKIDKVVTFISAPGYFGDGYVMPIFALSVEGEILLEYEQGYTNYIEELKQ